MTIEKPEGCWIRHKPVTQFDPLKWFIHFYDENISIYVYHTVDNTWWVDGTFLNRQILNAQNEKEAKDLALNMMWDRLLQYADRIKSVQLFEYFQNRDKQENN